MKLENLFEKKLEWHDSNAPDANGKFKDLSINDLAAWLIKTRNGDLQKITGSINQQIAFNKNKNPSYAAKMEKVRAAIKRKLVKENMDHSKDDQAVPQLKAALLAQKKKLKSLKNADEVYKAIDEIMNRVRKAHKLSGQKIHDMWVKKYKEIPDTWIMHQ